jgi:hypothetical protein
MVLFKEKKNNFPAGGKFLYFSNFMLFMGDMEIPVTST